jgi:hypothetical protein
MGCRSRNTQWHLLPVVRLSTVGREWAAIFTLREPKLMPLGNSLRTSCTHLHSHLH